MSRKYIRENKNSFAVNRNSRTYGKFTSLNDAIFARDLLVENDWNLDSISEIHKIDDTYIVVGIIDEKLHVLAKFRQKPSKEAVDRLIKRKRRNPNDSKYGLNITRVFDTFIIKKQIAGDDYVFGYYDNLADAEFVRNFLMDHMWDVNEFSQVQYDGDTDTFKVVEVIDDKVYVLSIFDDDSVIDLDKCHEEFLTKISKHKFGLASHPYLDELVDMLPELEKRFEVRANDDVWSFENTQNPLNDMIFKLTPFQKSVYDALDDKKTLDEIAQALIRYKSGNFTQKIQRNLNELIDMGLVLKDGEYFKKS